MAHTSYRVRFRAKNGQTAERIILEDGQKPYRRNLWASAHGMTVVMVLAADEDPQNQMSARGRR